jgi:hypothetical protein
MAKRKEKTIYKTLYGKLKIKQHEPHLKPAVNSGAPEGPTVPAPYVTYFYFISYCLLSL